jgi:hypothetical protein
MVVKKDTPQKTHYTAIVGFIKRFLELAERLDSLASAGEDTEDVESDLRMSMLV